MVTKCARACIVSGTLIGITLPSNALVTPGHAKNAEIRKVEYPSRASSKRDCSPVPVGQEFSTPLRREAGSTVECADTAAMLPFSPYRQSRLVDRRVAAMHFLPVTAAIPPQRTKTPSSSRRRHLGSFAMTAYTQYHNPPQRTASGTMPATGRTVAVDPKVIPLGTKLHIEGVGIRIAEDTGRKIKGKKLDLFLSSMGDCTRFGVRSRQVYILD